MKRVLCFLVAASLLLYAAACGKAPAGNSASAGTKSGTVSGTKSVEEVLNEGVRAEDEKNGKGNTAEQGDKTDPAGQNDKTEPSVPDNTGKTEPPDPDGVDIDFPSGVLDDDEKSGTFTGVYDTNYEESGYYTQEDYQNGNIDPSIYKDGRTTILSNEKGIDIDLTKLSTTIFFAEVYNMFADPAAYEGKTVKLEGIFTPYYDPEEDENIFICVMQDASACCGQALEFRLDKKYKYPKDFPQEGEMIRMVGRFELYNEYDEENKEEYVNIRIADGKLI